MSNFVQVARELFINLWDYGGGAKYYHVYLPSQKGLVWDPCIQFQ